jgi:hypothetical protein
MTLERPYHNRDPLQGGIVRHIIPNPNSESCFALVKHWLKTCTERHLACSEADSNTSHTLPKRAIQVGLSDNATIRLFEHNDFFSVHDPPYLALSHCWGQSQHLTLTKATLAERKLNIAWESLPRTFQDAILVTRGIGVEFLWIDSLCIIQDDVADWEAEAAKMASIYDGAYMVLSATASSDGDGGCLFAREPYIEVKGVDHDGAPFGLFARRQCPHDVFNWEEDLDEGQLDNYRINQANINYPLFTRAWCFQERLLATRTLHFTKYEMVFDCLAAVECECGALSTFPSAALRPSRNLVKSGKTSAPLLSTGDVRSVHTDLCLCS